MRIPAWRYSLLNLASALIWTPTMAWLGYAFGKSVHAFINGLYLQLAIYGPLMALSLMIWFFGWKGLRDELTVLRLHIHLPHAVSRWPDLGIKARTREPSIEIHLARHGQSGP
jgi:hypothetical protein